MGCLYRRKTCEDCGHGRLIARCQDADHRVVERGPFWIKYSVNGKPHCESTQTEKKVEAQRILNEREGDKAKGRPVSAKASQLKFEEALEDLRTNRELRGKRGPGTRADYLAKTFGGLRMATITTSDVERYAVKRKKDGASNATVNRELAVLKRMFTLSIRAGKLYTRPYIEMLHEDNVRTGFFERAQFDALLKHLPARLRGVAILGYWTGMRRGEILGDPNHFDKRPGLQWRRVDRKAMVIRLDPGTTKNREGRTIPYGDVPELREAIEAQWKAHEKLLAKGIISNLVFPRLRGTKNPGGPIIDFRKAWNGASEAAGVPGRRFHDLRRTAVRDLTRAGVPRQTAMTITGHKTESVFNRYDIVDTNDRREAMRRRAAAG